MVNICVWSSVTSLTSLLDLLTVFSNSRAMMRAIAWRASRTDSTLRNCGDQIGFNSSLRAVTDYRGVFGQ